MTGHKEFVDCGMKAEKDTLSKRVAKKDLLTGFGIEFVGRIGTQPGKT